MPIPGAVNNSQDYNFDISTFNAVQHAANSSSKSYVYINKKGKLAVRGAFANFFGIGGIKDSKKKTLEAFQRALKNEIDSNIDIFANNNEITIKKGEGLTIGVMTRTIERANKIKENNELKQRNKLELNNKLDTLKDSVISETDGGNNIKLTDDLRELFLDKINKLKELKDMSVDFKFNLIKNSMKFINDKLTKQEIEGWDDNGYNSTLTNLNQNNDVMFGIKYLLGAEKSETDVLEAVKQQYNLSHVSDNKFDTLIDSIISLRSSGGNNIKLTKNLNQIFLDRINKNDEWKDMDVDSKVDLIKNSMIAINDVIQEQDIEDLDKNGYQELQNKIERNIMILRDVKYLLGAEDVMNAILEAAKNRK